MACVETIFDDVISCPTATEGQSGFAGTVLAIRTHDITAEPIVPVLGATTTAEDYVTATGAFTFKANKKPAVLEVISEYLEAPGTSIGSMGNLGASYSPKLRLQNTAQSTGWIKKNANIPMILGTEKPGGKKKLYGSRKFPVWIESWNVVETGTDNYIEVTFKSQPTYVAFYEGDIPLTPGV
ncbi:hypothetical protein [Siphonobacter sp. SORGH_AS_0500]|uniref:hypothetical protein n=1 Tax=Siphonobacter sp. SORGH_AS_0500 TaxID=1864824 RepID=UPI0028651399|nr:hypothetical protein [Siphonobacter sp. SORGH_AS_0500]MDR6196160.1 hypothetical protein [Siphonobacter sp. SORGH_AS_0500]